MRRAEAAGGGRSGAGSGSGAGRAVQPPRSGLAMLSLDFLDDVRRMNKRQVPNRGGGRVWVGNRVGPGPGGSHRAGSALPGTGPRSLTGPLFPPPPSPKLYYQVLNFGMIVSSALMIWKGLMVVTGSESPIVVVLR